MKVLVCGSRKYPDELGLWNRLSGIYNTLYWKGTPITLVIQGGAKGADAFARSWAHLMALQQKEFPANWRQYGESAGPRRNQQMLDEGHPELVIAFPWPSLAESRGTKDMVNRARAAGIETIVIDE